jgi:AbrB family looped-hinge helix DNA binding protein
MAATAKVGRRGQITLPKEVRERLSLEEGQRLAFVSAEEGVTLLPMTSAA